MDSGVEDSDDETDGSFWQSLRLVAAVFEPCYKLMRLTDSPAPLMGKFYRLMSDLGGALENMFENKFPGARHHGLTTRRRSVKHIHSDGSTYTVTTIVRAMLLILISSTKMSMQ